MALTFTSDMPRPERVSRSLGRFTGTLSASGTYSSGGFSLPTTLTDYFKDIYSVNLLLGISNERYEFAYDRSNDKIIVYEKNPPLVVVQELVTVTSNVGTLKYRPAFINWIADGNTPYIPLAPTTGGIAVASGHCAVDLSNGTLTFLAGDSVSSVTVSYITKAAKDFADNIVTEEEVTLSDSGVDLENAAVAIQYVTDNDDGDTLKPVANTAAAGEVLVGWTDGASSVTELTVAAGDDGNDGLVTYIKDPGSGFLNDRFIEDEEVAVGGDDEVESSYPILAISTAGFFTSDDGDPCQLIKDGGTVGASGELATCLFTAGYGPIGGGNICQFDLSSDNDPTNSRISYLWGYPWELNRQQIEPLGTVSVAAIPIEVIGTI